MILQFQEGPANNTTPIYKNAFRQTSYSLSVILKEQIILINS